MLELDGQDFRVPAGIEREPVIGNHKGPLLLLAEMLDPDYRDGLHAQELGSLEATVARNDLVIAVDQQRIVEAKFLDRGSNLLDLLLRVHSGVGMSRSE